MPLAPGATIERYTIQAQLGAGGMGEVYRAYDNRLHRSVALKLLIPPEDAPADSKPSATGGLQRMLREARSAAALEHPNVVAVYDVGEAKEPRELAGTVYLAMELIKGEPLRSFFDRSPPMSTRIKWLVDVARALSAAHAQDLVHRDVKPENIMVRDDGVIKVLDFGIAKRVKEAIDPTAATEQGLTTTTKGLAIGTPYYMSPEQMRAEELDGRTDQFSWGVVAYELLGGKGPWRADLGALNLVSQVLSTEPTPLEQMNPEVPRNVAKIVMRALSKPRERRFSSMDELIAALESPDAAATQRALAAPVRRGPKTKLVAAGLALLVVILVAAFARVRTPTRGAVSSAPATAPPECARAADCARLHPEAAHRCTSAGRCAALAAPGCEVLAERSDVESDRTTWVGALLPLSLDRRDLNAVDLARQDFAQALGRFAASGEIRPIAVVACDDQRDPTAAARHLVENVEAKAILGFSSSRVVRDLAADLLIPRGVLAVVSLTTASSALEIPEPPGQPRLVWRTTYNMSHNAGPIAAFVGQVLEPMAKAKAPGDARVKVALLRPKTPGGLSLSAELRKSLRFNGMSALENDEDYLEIAYDDSGTNEAQKSLADAARALAAFSPSVVVFWGDGGLVASVVAPLEQKWPAGRPRPFWVGTDALSPEFFGFIGKDADRRRRFFAVTSVSTIEANIKFVNHYNETFADKITRTLAPNTSYDAFYLVAYAAYALGEAPTGAALGRAIARLQPPGKPVDVGPADIFDAYQSLRAGKDIDLSGAIGRLDFDLARGEAPVDMAILCVGVDAKGEANDGVESGVVFDATSRKLTGTLRCP